MINIKDKEYVVVVQCHIVKERCSGYNCERAFNERSGGFASYPKEKSYRMINLTCGGCCGRAIHRKLSHFARWIKKEEGLEKDKIVVQLSSCITKNNFHAPPCPHLDYIKELLTRLNLDVCEDTYISKRSEERRKAGLYCTQ